MVIAPLMLIIAKRNFRENQQYGGYSIIVTVAISLCIGLYYIINAISIYIQSLSYLDPLSRLQFVQGRFFLAGLFPYNIGAITLFTLPLFIIAIGIFAWAVNITEKKGMSKGDPGPTKAKNSIDLEISRKLFHIGLIALLVLYIMVGKMVVSNIFGYYSDTFCSGNLAGNFIPFDDFYNLNLTSYEPYMGQTMMMFAFIVVFFLVLFADLVRIYKPKYYLLKTISQQWRSYERGSFGPHIHMLMGCLFVIIFFRPPIACVAITITALGDGVATIIGVAKGKRKLRAGSEKTWEGAIAGFLASFIFGFMLYFVMIGLASIYGPFYQGTVLGGIIISLVGATTFFIIDYISLPISDNILNPVVCGCVMWLVSLVII